ncbi:hypothetical protein ABEB36_009116 [Hypothenemus hampei]|uniref:Uncharacterized protein n=1 Tax=Hypothenemus hampei TaxID=57062 RepID=A0ABD1EPT8_HYPHA
MSEKKIKKITELTCSEVQNLINSVDIVLFDIDGALLVNSLPLPGSTELIAKLRKLNKDIRFVTNNTLYSIETIKDNLRFFNAEHKDIFTPIPSLLEYIKLTNYTQDIYVIGSSTVTNILRQNGLKIIEFKDIHPSLHIEETGVALKELLLKALEIFQVADALLRNIKSIKLISGISDDMTPLARNLMVIGTKYYLDGLERWSGMKAIPMAKPAHELGDILKSVLNITDSQRVLMVGDNVETDIGFGVNSGFKTFLVLTGATTKEQVEIWKYSESLKPDYLAQDLEDLYEKIKEM